jgi:hypothetical protein
LKFLVAASARVKTHTEHPHQKFLGELGHDIFLIPLLHTAEEVTVWSKSMLLESKVLQSDAAEQISSSSMRILLKLQANRKT